MKRHGDVLLFQLGNWLSGFVWFGVFLRLASSPAFAQIAGAELMFGFFGVFITNLSLRLQGQAHSQALELRLLRLRLGAFVLVALAVALGVGTLAGALAMASIALTPAHLPLLLSHQPWLLIPLLARLPLALLALLSGYLPGSPDALAAIYFSPGLVYGVLAYWHYFRQLSAQPADTVRHSAAQVSPAALIGQLLATAAASLIQARIVTGLVLAQPGYALAERLLRSAHSFAFPHLLRRGLLTPTLRTVLAVLSVAAILGLVLINLPPDGGAGVFLPTLLDAFSTIAAGSMPLLDALFIVAAGLYLAK